MQKEKQEEKNIRSKLDQMPGKDESSPTEDQPLQGPGGANNPFA